MSLTSKEMKRLGISLSSSPVFPKSVKFRGQTFVPSGKMGKNLKTGFPSQEYVLPDERVWVVIDPKGKVIVEQD